MGKKDGNFERYPNSIKKKKNRKFTYSNHSHLHKKLNKAMVEGQRCLSDF